MVELKDAGKFLSKIWPVLLVFLFITQECEIRENRRQIQEMTDHHEAFKMELLNYLDRYLDYMRREFSR